MRACRGVVCVRAAGRVVYWSFAFSGTGTEFLERGVCERLAVAVLAEPHCLGHPVLEADHVVFPVADVVTQFAAEDCVALVVGVKVEVEYVGDGEGGFGVDDDCAGYSVRCFSGCGVWNYTCEPGGRAGDVVVRG